MVNQEKVVCQEALDFKVSYHILGISCTCGWIQMLCKIFNVNYICIFVVFIYQDHWDLSDLKDHKVNVVQLDLLVPVENRVSGAQSATLDNKAYLEREVLSVLSENLDQSVYLENKVCKYVTLMSLLQCNYVMFSW